MRRKPLPLGAEVSIGAAATHIKNARGRMIKLLGSTNLTREDRESLVESTIDVGVADSMLRIVASENEDMADEASEDNGNDVAQTG